MRKFLFVLLFILMGHCTANAQLIAPLADSLTGEQYSTFLTQYYKDALGLSSWQANQTYKVILKEKDMLDTLLIKSTVGERDKCWKKYYSLLDSKFFYIFTDDQYKEYKHLNAIQIKTVGVQ